MSKITKVTVLIFTHIVALLIGGSLVFSLMGLSMKKEIVEANTALQPIELIAKYSAYLDVQRVQGDAESYQKALLAYLAFLDQKSGVIKQPEDLNFVNSEKMFAAAKLALIEQRKGDKIAAESYISRAEKYCKDAGLKNCEQEKILHAAHILNEKSISR